MQISIQEAYAEACAALGEQIVERRLMARAEAQRAVEVEAKVAAEAAAEAEPEESGNPEADPIPDATDAEQETPPADATHAAPNREVPKPSDTRSKK